MMVTASSQTLKEVAPIPAGTGDALVLENGDRLPAAEFLRRFEAMPALKKAELVQGIVYMLSPVRAIQHGDPDSLVQTWLGTFSIATPGVKSSTNATVRLGPEDVAQPDGLLRIVEECGGRSRVDESGLLVGAPEFVFEVAGSSVSMDVNAKKTSYLRSGVLEYVVWRTLDEAVDWFRLEDDEFRPLPVGEDGIHGSVILPGLWLDVPALVAQDGARVMEVLQKGLASTEHAEFMDKLRQLRTSDS